MRTNDESTRAIATGTTKARGRLNIRLIHRRGRDMNLKKRGTMRTNQDSGIS